MVTLIAIDWEQGQADWEKYPKKVVMDTKEVSMDELRSFILGFQPPKRLSQNDNKNLQR